MRYKEPKGLVHSSLNIVWKADFSLPSVILVCMPYHTSIISPFLSKSKEIVGLSQDIKGLFSLH